MAITEPILVAESLPTIELDLLRADNETENKRLLGVCQNYGFFYLNMTSDPELCQLWEDMLSIMKEYFEQPLDIKMQDARNDDNFGYVTSPNPFCIISTIDHPSYEPMGTEEGPKPKTRDGYESLKV